MDSEAAKKKYGAGILASKKYAAGILANLTALDNATSVIIAKLKSIFYDAEKICDAIKAELLNGNPVMVLQYGTGKNDKKQIGHAVVGYAYHETPSNVAFWIADSNRPNTRVILEFDKATRTWKYYWDWDHFQIGMLRLDHFDD
jgi:hypothetical protein